MAEFEYIMQQASRMCDTQKMCNDKCPAYVHRCCCVSVQGKGILTDGTIDEGYTGEICVVLFNLSNNPRFFLRGEKIAQLVVQPVIYPEIEIVDELASTDRGANGFGSTGK